MKMLSRYRTRLLTVSRRMSNLVRRRLCSARSRELASLAVLVAPHVEQRRVVASSDVAPRDPLLPLITDTCTRNCYLQVSAVANSYIHSTGPIGLNTGLRQSPRTLSGRVRSGHVVECSYRGLFDLARQNRAVDRA